MKANPIILVALIVVLPLALLAWAARYIASHEQAMVQQRFQQWMTQRLEDINGSLVRHFDKVARELRQLTAIDDFNIDRLRELTRREPRFLQLFVLAPDGNLQFPDPQQPLNDAERSFLLRTSKMFIDQDLKTAIALTAVEEEAAQGLSTSLPDGPSKYLGRSLTQQFESSRAQSSSNDPKASHVSEGWFVWYWDRGQNLIYWQRRPSGHLVGVALERARWMADLIGELPDTAISPKYSLKSNQALESGLRLVDAASATVYQWGSVPANADSTKPLCEIPVASPLGSWRLQCVISPDFKNLATGRGLQFGLWAGWIGTGVGLATLATLLLRGYARDMREASQQVSFVNHVSHELKTPLTNIRMYAELLDRDLKALKGTDVDQPQQRLNVIVSESERLSRLIGNVLTFARHQRKTLQPQPRIVIPDECIARVVDRFRPSLAALNIAVELDTNALEERLLDPDFVNQILGNLISNVEKYAAKGGRLDIRSSLTDDTLTIRVEDRGPGIPSNQREEIFRPFKRLDNDISYAAGTGIGLTIARELARLHGGDVRLLESEQGSVFEIRLRCQRVS